MVGHGWRRFHDLLELYENLLRYRVPLVDYLLIPLALAVAVLLFVWIERLRRP